MLGSSFGGGGMASCSWLTSSLSADMVELDGCLLNGLRESEVSFMMLFLNPPFSLPVRGGSSCTGE